MYPSSEKDKEELGESLKPKMHTEKTFRKDICFIVSFILLLF